MPEAIGRATLAAAGATGVNTHAAVVVPDDTESIAVEFEVTAVGATPTITWKVQGSLDENTVSDAASDWFDLGGNPADSATEAVSTTKTAVGVYTSFYNELPRKIRLVVTGNTNVTYGPVDAVFNRK